jgi:hypothetical protein
VTRVTQLTYKPDISPDGSQIRLRQHGTVFIFFTKKSRCEFFVKKHGASALPEAISLSGVDILW